jgi:hypothetical protein
MLIVPITGRAGMGQDQTRTMRLWQPGRSAPWVSIGSMRARNPATAGKNQFRNWRGMELAANCLQGVFMTVSFGNLDLRRRSFTR